VWYIGLDLGKQSDYTALAIVEKTEPPRPAPRAEDTRRRDHRGRVLCDYHVRYLHRPPLGTSYADIVTLVGELVRRPELHPDPPPGESPVKPRLAVDASGVGQPVVDLFANEKLPVRLHPIAITPGDSWTRTGMAFNVSKLLLVSTVQALLGTRRLQVVPELPHAETLKQELLNFQIRVTPAANQVFNAREGAHDDLLLAVALAVWLGENDLREQVVYRWGRPAPAGC
jgi:hypothetical protein